MMAMQQQMTNAANLAAAQTAANNEAQVQASKKTEEKAAVPKKKDEAEEGVDPQITRQWRADEEYCRNYRKVQNAQVDSDSDTDQEKPAPSQTTVRKPLAKKMPIPMHKLCSVRTDAGDVELFARHIHIKEDDKKEDGKNPEPRQPQPVVSKPREPDCPPPRHLQHRRCPSPKPHYGGADGQKLVLHFYLGFRSLPLSLR